MSTNAQMRDYLMTRRSVGMAFLKDPGPTAAELEQILTIGTRVPDHGKLAPWRFILFEGDGRKRVGELLAACVSNQPDVSPERIEHERGRFLRAPMILGVVSRAREQIAIPVWEQELSAGAVCQTILIAAHAMGFVANWITEWCAYHPRVLGGLGLRPGERMAGFIYIGHPATPLEDRPRPDIGVLLTRF